MGRTSAEMARDVERTRQQMEDKLNELASRAPEEVRELAKRALVVALTAVVFVPLTAVAVMVARKRLDRAWTRAWSRIRG